MIIGIFTLRMKTLFHKPHLIGWLAIPVLVFSGLLFRQHTFDIPLYDTYFVVANPPFTLAGSALLLLSGGVYWLLGLSGKIPNRVLSLIHILPTISVLILFSLPLFTLDTFVDQAWISFRILAFLLGQCAFVSNILITFLRN